VTNLAHQLGYFHVVAGLDVFASLPDRIAAVTADDVARVAHTYLDPSTRTIGWFDPER